MAHRHRASDDEDRPYMGGAKNQAAAGCITRHEECSCGATRVVHINGRHREYGAWEEDGGRRRDPAMRRFRLRGQRYSG